jgi:TRAP-type C4-dicarboxylate transport system permease small subunit
LILRAADALTRGAGALGTLCFGALIALMLFEVVARYAFAAPTIWTTETVAMLNGAGFLFAAGLALREGAHVGIDVFARRLPPRLRAAILATFLLLVFAPLLLWLFDVAQARAVTAFATGEVDDVSPWRRPVWPFHAAMAAGLFCFAVSVAAEGARQAGRAWRG